MTINIMVDRCPFLVTFTGTIEVSRAWRDPQVDPYNDNTLPGRPVLIRKVSDDAQAKVEWDLIQLQEWSKSTFIQRMKEAGLWDLDMFRLWGETLANRYINSARDLAELTPQEKHDLNYNCATGTGYMGQPGDWNGGEDC